MSSGVVCHSCGAPAAGKRCSGCQTAHYCDRYCQSDDWARHKQECMVGKKVVEQKSVDKNAYKALCPVSIRSDMSTTPDDALHYALVGLTIDVGGTTRANKVVKFINRFLKSKGNGLTKTPTAKELAELKVLLDALDNDLKTKKHKGLDMLLRPIWRAASKFLSNPKQFADSDTYGEGPFSSTCTSKKCAANKVRQPSTAR
jgi:hypothetical protein